MPRGPVGRGLFPPQARIEVITIASDTTAQYDCSATRWSLDDLALELVNRHADDAMSRTTIARILAEADLKPHRSVYWLNSHDPNFDTIAKEICGLYVQSPTLQQHGHLIICTDEKTGMQILDRKHPTQPARPGHPEKREHEYIRYGTRALINSFVVPTGEIVWNLGMTRTAIDFANHIQHVANHYLEYSQITWIVDNLNTHYGLPICEVLAKLNGLKVHLNSLQTPTQRKAFVSDPTHRYRFLFTPIHGSWLNQVELWFSVLARRFLKRGDFRSALDFEIRLAKFLTDYNEHHAHPYRWTYTGQPLVRATPFSQTRRQQMHGRAWFSTRPQRFQRSLYSPRPYKRTSGTA